MSGELIAKALALILLAEDYRGVDSPEGWVGKYQLSAIMVRDVNRILGKEVYTYSDRSDPVKSRKMVIIYLRHYGTAKRIGREPTVQDLVLIHAAGPDGWKQSEALWYWQVAQNKGRR
jgi:hypothetical protein